MNNRAISSRHFDADKQESSDDPSVDRPQPSDFDIFVPWACKEYRVDAEVIVTRAVQTVYVSAAISKKPVQKRKVSKPPSLTIQEHVSNLENNSSEMDKLISEVAEKIVKIETVYNSNENLVQLKFLNNKEIPKEVIQVVGLTIPFQRHLSSITINSGLNCLYTMSKFLPDSQITEICLDGTFIREANYHVLLINSKLKHLSLVGCKINDDVVKLIADQIKDPCPPTKILSALNLSTNKITDMGAKYIASMLRTNRQLCYLNLASNMITDEGGVSILNTLQRFPLQPEELYETGARYVDYLKKKSELINTYVIELQTAAFGKNNKKKPLKKATKVESLCLQQHYEIAEARIILEKAECLAECKLGLFNEAFSLNNTETRNGVVHCSGNNTLCYLNLSYNSLTYLSLKKLVDVLQTQKSLNRTPRGLIKVLIEGNLLPVACEEFQEINKLLSGTSSSRKSSEVQKKKPALSPKSIIK